MNRSYDKEEVCNELKNILTKLKNLRGNMEIIELDDVIKDVESLMSALDTNPGIFHSTKYGRGYIRFLISAYMARTPKANMQENMVNSIKQNILKASPVFCNIEISKIELLPSYKKTKISKYGKGKKSVVRRFK